MGIQRVNTVSPKYSGMTLDEAIRHCRDIEKSCKMSGNDACGVDHAQLALWLEHYKSLLMERTDKRDWRMS